MERDAAREVARRVDALLRRACRAGLRHLPRSALGELQALEQAAHVAGLVHVERELAGVATALERALDRDPQHRAASLVAALARVRARVRAAEAALAAPASPRDEEVFGVARRRYDDVAGTLVVEALAAVGYVTESGFTGVSVTLVAVDTGEELVASVVRPTDWFGDEPRRLWFQPVSDATPLAVADLAHGAWQLDGAKRSADGRLSLHAGLLVTPAGPTPARTLAPYRVPGLREGVDRVARDLAADEEAGVRLAIEGLRPAGVAVDETRGVATVSFTDQAGAVARQVVPMVPRNDLLLDNLARLRVRPPGLLVGRLSASAQGLSFEAQTAWFDQPVRLPHRRSGPVSEVHLGLETLPGDVDRAASAVPGAPAVPPDPARAAVDHAHGLLVALFASGTGRPEDLGSDLLAAASRAEDTGLPGLGRALARVSEALAAGLDASDALLAAAERCRLTARGLTLAALGTPEPPVSAPPLRRGADRRLWPVGVVRDRARALVVAIDAADGARWTVRDEWHDLPGGRVASRLFQAEIDPREALGRAWELVDHPASRGRDGRELASAWHTAPTLGPPVRPDLIPEVDAPAPGLFRCAFEAAAGPDGWVLTTAGGPCPAEVSEAAALDLAKRPSPVRAVGTFAPVAGALRLLAVDGAHPDVDPAATRWPWSALVARAAGGPLAPLVEAIGRGALPAVEDDPAVLEAAALPAAEGRRRLLAAVVDARRSVSVGDPMPPARALWSWGRALGGHPPIAALGLPPIAVRRAIVRPLARWLAGGPDDPEEALLLLAGAGERDVHFAGAPDA
jgi:hypothetical protein